MISPNFSKLDLKDNIIIINNKKLTFENISNRGIKFHQICQKMTYFEFDAYGELNLPWIK